MSDLDDALDEVRTWYDRNLEDWEPDWDALNTVLVRVNR